MDKKIEEAFKKVEKVFGKNSIMFLGESRPATENLISTGSLLIDKALGGGIGSGRVVEVFGPESSGKSTLALQIARECQKQGGMVAYLDNENALDVEYARKLGVDVDNMAFAQPTTAEETLTIANMLAKEGIFRLIIIDSVAAMVPKTILEGEVGDVTVGLAARLMSKGLAMLTGTLNNNSCTILFINQLRDKIATGWSSGPSETTTGGRALKFYASQRIELRKTKGITEGDDVVGQNVKVKVVKNKVGVPMKTVELPLIFGKGFSAEDEVIDLAIEYGFIEKTGGWYTTHDGQRLNGKAAVREYYESNHGSSAELREKVVSVLKGDANIIHEGYEIDPETGEVITE